MRKAALLVAVVCLLVAPLAGAAATSTATPGAASGDGAEPVVRPATGPALQESSLAREGVDIAVELQPDGDARWNVSATYRLDGENDSAAFDRLVEQFKNYETDNGFSVGVFRAVAPEVSERVGRPMEIVGDDRTATTVDRGNESTGVLSLRFTWTNFSQVTNETLVVDGFSGSWFGDLGADQTLTIRPPDGYGTETVEPETSVVGSAYRWQGPQEFSRGQPTLVFTGSPGGPGPGGLPVAAMVGVAGLLVAGGALAWAYRQGKLPDVGGSLPGSGEQTGGETTPSSGGDAAGGVAGEGGEAAGEGGGVAPGGDATAGGDAAAGGDGAAGAGAGAGAGAAAGDEVDGDLLSDEERVERLLEANGGRMKQSKIVEETRWSTAKVSQLLSGMADEGRVEKLRIGRENLISLPGEGVNDE